MQRKNNDLREKRRPKRAQVVENSAKGFADALRLIGVEIWHDVREERFFYRHAGMKEPLTTNDLFMNWARFQVAEKVYVKTKDGPAPWRIGKDHFYALRDAHVYNNSTDSFLEYLKGLPPIDVSQAEIDDYETPIDHMLADVLGVANDAYHKHISRMITLAAVWRAFEPGYKQDEVAVIKGKQGIGKDTVLSSLLPKQRWHTDAFSFALDSKRKIEVTRGKVLVVASEMGGVTTTRDLEHLKQYVTAQVDDIRMAYRRDADHMPRRYIFVCTTNLDKPLPDDATGNRRWCVAEALESQVGAVEPFMENCRDRLWAVAVALYRRGVRPNLPRHMKAIQAAENEDYRRADETLQNAYVKAVTSNDLQLRPQTLTQIAEKMDMIEVSGNARKMPREMQHRLRQELELQGWTARTGRLKRGGPKQRLWFPDNIERENDE